MRDVHVVTLPTPTVQIAPRWPDYRKLIALMNRAVSLSGSPGAQILQRFDATAVGDG